jgi:HNH endonuclease
MSVEPITAGRLRELLHYDPEAGVFRWLRSGSGRCLGGIAGCRYGKGYARIRIMISGRWYKAHRLAWLWMMGEWPLAEIDHINMDSADNRWCNLRAATHSKNGANKRKQQNNTSGFPGVSRFGVKWRARSKVNGKEVSLGLFDTRHQAYAAKCLDSRRNFGEYTRCYDDDIMIEPGPQSLGNDWLGI